jgi:hypothetical protein
MECLQAFDDRLFDQDLSVYLFQEILVPRVNEATHILISG